MKKNYAVISELEHFKKINEVYRYECLVNYESNKFFETEEEARKYMNDKDLYIDFQDHNLYIEFLSLFKYDDELEDIVGECIYNYKPDTDLLENEKNIKIEY